MAKYHLRNQDKIQDWYDKKTLKTILDSIDSHLQEYGELQIEKEWTGEKYPIALIDQKGHSVNMIALYIIEFKDNFYRLAFKEFIG